jgi:hypothetical protein
VPASTPVDEAGIPICSTEIVDASESRLFVAFFHLVRCDLQPQFPSHVTNIALLPLQFFFRIFFTAHFGSIQRGRLDNLHSNLITCFERLVSPLYELSSWTDETANSHFHLMPTYAHDVVTMVLSTPSSPMPATQRRLLFR